MIVFRWYCCTVACQVFKLPTTLNGAGNACREEKNIIFCTILRNDMIICSLTIIMTINFDYTIYLCMSNTSHSLSPWLGEGEGREGEGRGGRGEGRERGGGGEGGEREEICSPL